MKSTDMEAAAKELAEYERWSKAAKAAPEKWAIRGLTVANVELPITDILREAIARALRDQARVHLRRLAELGVEVGVAKSDAVAPRCSCGKELVDGYPVDCKSLGCHMRHRQGDEMWTDTNPMLPRRSVRLALEAYVLATSDHVVDDRPVRQGLIAALVAYERDVRARKVRATGTAAEQLDAVDPLENPTWSDYDRAGIRRVAERALKDNADPTPGAVLRAASAAPHLALWVLKLTTEPHGSECSPATRTSVTAAWGAQSVEDIRHIAERALLPDSDIKAIGIGDLRTAMAQLGRWVLRLTGDPGPTIPTADRNDLTHVNCRICGDIKPMSEARSCRTPGCHHVRMRGDRS